MNGDILLDAGIIKRVGIVERELLSEYVRTSVGVVINLVPSLHDLPEATSTLMAVN